jgi:hypothetical protein
MSRQNRPARTNAPTDSRVPRFVSRADQLRLRGQRNFDRWMMVTKKFVAADSPERIRWQTESAEESQRDVAWNRRHGPIRDGATILPWRDEHEGRARPSASAR